MTRPEALDHLVQMFLEGQSEKDVVRQADTFAAALGRSSILLIEDARVLACLQTIKAKA